MHDDDDKVRGCLFPGECCMPGEHDPSECFTAEMMQAFEEEFEQEYRKCHRPLGCDCDKCIKRFGPIAPGNVGKDLRSNPTGNVTNPRRA